jgi:peptidoglycan L-alanyl-D-glutamate endopeptidase CwlK
MKIKIAYAAKHEKLHPEFKKRRDKILRAIRSQGYEIAEHKGMRTFAEQAHLYEKGRSRPGNIVTNARPGRSWHNYGLASDLVFLKNGKWSWSEEHPWELIGKYAKEYGLKWGGDFRKLKDRPHVQFSGTLTTTKARSFYMKGGLKNVWKHIRFK